jgi:DHA2 family multidrug resistance protein-like MFS transporter
VTINDTPRAGRREWAGLAVLAFSALFVSIDFFVLLLALPKLSVALGAGATQQLWITDIYGFVLAGFLVTMGTLGDRIGRRRLLLIGGAAFAACSLLAAFSTNPAMLITARALLGVAGATVTPSTLALIGNMFHDAKQRGVAISIWMSCFIAGSAIGQLLGGVLLNYFWWGSVFLPGVVAMVLLLVTGRALLPEFRNPNASKLDLVSVALSLATILPFIYGLKSLVTNGFQVLPAVAVVVGLVVGVLFVRRQRSLAEPLLDLRLFANRSFSVTLGTMLFSVMLSGAIMLFLTQYLQLVKNLSPLESGLLLLPSSAASVIGIMVPPMVARRIRPAFVIGGGLVISVLGLLLVTTVSSSSNVAQLVGGMALVFFGAGPILALGTGIVMGSVPPEKIGSAAAISQTTNELGFALGIATLGSLGAAVYRAQVQVPTGVPANAAAAAHASLAGATGAAHQLPAGLGTQLAHAAEEAFTTGMGVAAAVAAGVLLIVAALATVLLRSIPATGTPPQQAPEAPEESVDKVSVS